MEVHPTTFFLIWSGILVAMGVPMVLKLVPPNRLHGIRTKATLSNRAIWYRANYFCGWSLVVAGIVSAMILYFAPEARRPATFYGCAAFGIPLAVAVIVSSWYARSIADNRHDG